VCSFILALLYLLNAPYRLISRFFLNLRGIYYHVQSTVGGQAISRLSVVRTNPYWKRPNRFTLTTGFSGGFVAETTTSSGEADRNVAGMPQADTIDLEVAMEMQTRQDIEEDEMKSVVADRPPKD
jgi:hypothetical protein